MASQTPPSGTFAGRYTIERELGRGGTATVYLARDETTSTSVALKVLRRELVESVAADRFLREFRMNAGVRHPHITPILNSGQFGADLFLVMPHMESGSLRTLLDKERQLSVDVVVEIVRGIGSALQHAHERGLIHRDVKPENILFTGDQAYLSDFGIARAVERVTGDSTTSSGIIRGTPAYMSPEQASGDHQFDGRSDQFSFACVVYEMLAGLPAFHGPTQESTIALRFKHAPREISVYRPGISQAIERVIQKAMSLSPADRYANMGEFVKAFDAATREPSGSARGRPLSGARGWRSLIATAAGVVILAALGAYGAKRWIGGTSLPRDSTQVIVMPAEIAEDSTAAARYELFHAALRRWTDLYVVPLDRTTDVTARRASGRLTSDDMKAVATSLGARRFVVVREVTSGTGRGLYAEYRDLQTGSLHAAQLDLPSDSSKIETTYSALADSLVLRGASDSGPPRPRGPRHLFATQAFIRAMNARQNWDLARADSELALAVSLDPGFSRAYLWLAQQKAWDGTDSQTWISLAERSLMDTMALTSRERLMAHALEEMGRAEYRKACNFYQMLIRADSSSFAGWYGLGECNRQDPIVLADAHSASGWRFRSSYQQTVVAYVRAFQLIPSTYRGFARNGFKRLRDLLFISGNHWTNGKSLATPASEFLGVPALAGDSIVLVARPKSEVTGQLSNVAPAEAVLRLRAVFDTVVKRWTGAFPRSADVKEALGTSLEMQGEPAAIDTMRAAVSLVQDRAERIRLTANLLAIRIKFAAAASDESALTAIRISADSLLREEARTSTPQVAGYLAPVAALIGRCGVTRTLLRQSTPAIGEPGAPHDVLVDIEELEGEIFAGCRPVDVRRRIDYIASRLTPPQPTAASRAQTEYWQLNRVVRSTEPLDSAWVTRLAQSGSGPTIVAERDLLEGRLDSARGRLRDLARARQATVLPGQVTADAVVAEARVWLMLADTAAAVASLDAALNSARQATPLGSADPRYNSARLGFLIQAYALRALLLARKNPEMARRNAVVALTLWRNADPDVRRTVARIQEVIK